MESVTKTVVIDDKEVQFPRLTLKDMFGICDIIQARNEDSAKKLCKEEGMDRYETLNVILELRRNKVSIQELLASANSPEGAYTIIAASLKKADINDSDDLISKVSIPDCIDLARCLTLDVQEEKKDKRPEVKPESPLSESPATSEESPKPQTTPEKSAKAKNIGYYGKK